MSPKTTRAPVRAAHRDITRATLRATPLPTIGANADKEARGRVLVIGGSTLVPGAMLLAGIAALRTGAGKLQMATVRDAAMPLAIAVPESLVVPLPQTRAGEIGGAGLAAALRSYVRGTDAVLLGPGMLSNSAAAALTRAVLDALGDETMLVLDGAAVVALAGHTRRLHARAGRVVLTPHSGEMASLLGVARDAIDADPAPFACDAAARFGATVALKGAETWIAEPSGALHRYRGGSVGLGTSGSGDTLAGIVAGVAARGGGPLEAASWGVWAHGAAGQRVAKRTAAVGYLARELLDELPALLGGDT